MRAYEAARAAPWAIYAPALRTVLEVADRSATVDEANLDAWKQHMAPEAVRAQPGTFMKGTRQAVVRDGVAILPVTGPIFPRANMLTEMSGATSLQGFIYDLQVVTESEDVNAILLDIDSPGGVAFGINEAAGLIRAAAAVKPLAAYVAGMGCSAAYWLASAAPTIVAERTAIVGSIGVVQGASVQEKPDLRGERHFEIVSSGAPGKRPDMTTDDGIAAVRATLDDLEAEFVTAVAAHRGVSESRVRSDFGQGDVLVAGKALAAGMIDAVGTFEEVLAGLAGKSGAGGAGPGTHARKDSSMSDKQKPATTDAPATITAETIAADHPAIAEQFRAEGRQAALADLDQARVEAATAERKRILGIEAQALPGHEALVAELKADGATTPEQAAVRIVQAEKATGGKVLQALAGDESASQHAPVQVRALPDAGPAVDPAAPLEDKAQAEWDSDADLRAEFVQYSTYLAYRRAEDAGTVVQRPPRQAAE